MAESFTPAEEAAIVARAQEQAGRCAHVWRVAGYGARVTWRCGVCGLVSTGAASAEPARQAPRIDGPITVGELVLGVVVVAVAIGLVVLAVALWRGWRL